MSSTPENGLEAALRDADGVVFLCSGNMVRSAFAELYARHLDCPVPVLSAATIFRNDTIYSETALALSARGVRPHLIRAFRPTHLDDLRPHIDGRPVVFGMTRSHLAEVEGHPLLVDRVFLLAAVDGLDSSDEEIADPVLEGADFARTFARVAECVESLLERLRAR